MTPGEGRTGAAAGGPAWRVDVLGVPVDAVDVPALHARLGAWVHGGGLATVLHANAHAINLARRHEWLRSIYQSADLVFCDGHGVRLAARVLGHVLPARITYAEWTWELARWCEADGVSLYLLGSREGVAALAAERLRARHPRLHIAGTHHGFLDAGAKGDDSAAVIATINARDPDILIVGMGMPRQEQWVHRHRAEIRARVVLTAGAAFDYVSGQLRRPPRWMTDHGLEWLGRLMIDPRRLAVRYLLGNPLFAARVVGYRVRHGRSRAELR